MVQDVSKFSEYERFLLVIRGCSLAMYEANKDKEKFLKYEYGFTDGFTQEELKEMEILFILGRLGFSFDELGTFLYKDVIMKLCDRLEGKSALIKDVRCLIPLLKELNDAYSPFYLSVARGDKDIGVKTFHLYIQKAFDQINEDCIDRDIVRKIYGSNEYEFDYGANAMKLAAYVLKMYSNDNALEYKKPVIKKVNRFPNDYELKNNF